MPFSGVSVLNNKAKYTQIDGCINPDVIADKKFSLFFKNTLTYHIFVGVLLKNEFAQHYPNYCGLY